MNKISISNAELTMLIEAIDYAAQQVHDSEIPVFNGFDYLNDSQIDAALESAYALKESLDSIAGNDALIIVED